MLLFFGYTTRVIDFHIRSEKAVLNVKKFQTFVVMQTAVALRKAERAQLKELSRLVCCQKILDILIKDLLVYECMSHFLY